VSKTALLPGMVVFTLLEDDHTFGTGDQDLIQDDPHRTIIGEIIPNPINQHI
jgi:hypothetical protein